MKNKASTLENGRMIVVKKKFRVSIGVSQVGDKSPFARYREVENFETGEQALEAAGHARDTVHGYYKDLMAELTESQQKERKNEQR